MSDEPNRPTSIREEIKQNKPFRSLGQEAYLALVRTADAAKRLTSRVLEVGGVTIQQYNVLRILRGAGEQGIPTLSIADRMVERTPGVTRILDRMEKKGWVARRRCTNDRRRVWCTITEDGLELLASLDEPVDQVEKHLSTAMDDRELEEFIGYLDRFRAYVREETD